jgi:predicted enzyme related to lactoylglutathione lyase
VTAHLVALTIDAKDPRRLAPFWAGVLGWEMADDPADGIALRSSDGTGFDIRFQPTQATKTRPDYIHLHLTSSSLEDQEQTVARALGLGGRHLDVGQLPEEGHVVLADPEGNEFCVIEPGNSYLAGCGFLGELACDGSREVGQFWSQALGWPLVWDQDEETAIQSPAGGTKIAWGGPRETPKTGRNRMHFDLAPPVDGDQQAEVDRLVSLGATQIDIGQGQVGWVVMADPDGNEFCLLTPR